MLDKPPSTNGGNHIQTKLAVGQCPAAFFLGMIAHMIAGAGRFGTLAHDQGQVPQPP
jgi:hypothetical protein